VRTRLIFAALAAAGILVAAGVGYAAYLASRDSVGLPATKLDRTPTQLAPARARRRQPVTTARTATVGTTNGDDRTSTTSTATVDDRSGRSPGGSGSGSGSGSGGSSNSGRGGGDD
jgi:uncharacterized membrane protein YgcG